jgi:hypothetical protein
VERRETAVLKLHTRSSMSRKRRADVIVVASVIVGLSVFSIAGAADLRNRGEPAPQREGAPMSLSDLNRPVDEVAAWPDTLWIFDADFEDLLGDNEGWEAVDLSGTPASENYWHKDTIRLGGHPELGDSSWWCGTYDSCWRQPRGYGNDWICTLERSFPEVPAFTDTGDVLVLEWDHRYAMEGCYDYGYVDASADDGSSWSTVRCFTNFSCAFGPGMGQIWTDTSVDLSAYAGHALSIRFRFTSDQVYSSEDQYDNVIGSCRDGAWQLDNIRLWTEWGSGPQELTIFLDDCESPGPYGWVTEDIPASGQTGAVYQRSYEEFDGHAGWMMATYDTVSGAMAPGQASLLCSPPIYVSSDIVPDATDLIVKCDGWFDLPGGSDEDVALMIHKSTDSPDCAVRNLPPTWWADWTERSVGPLWVSRADAVDYTGGGWLGLAFMAIGHENADPHGVGFVLDRVRVGVPDPTGVPDGGATVMMSGAHPNPLSESTVISYVLPDRSHVTLRIVNVAGRVVATLVDAVTDPGEHRVNWDGTTDAGDRAAAGVYFVRMELDGVPAGGAVRKMVLLK